MTFCSLMYGALYKSNESSYSPFPNFPVFHHSAIPLVNPAKRGTNGERITSKNDEQPTVNGTML